MGTEPGLLQRRVLNRVASALETNSLHQAGAKQLCSGEPDKLHATGENTEEYCSFTPKKHNRIESFVDQPLEQA